MIADSYIFNLINEWAGAHRWLDVLGTFFAERLEYFLIAALFLFLAKNFKKYWPMVWRAFAAAVLSRFVVTEIVRFLWARPRPFIAGDVNLLIDHPDSASFPSGHASFYFALATVVFLYNKKAGVLFLIASLLITISRVFVGVHWPSDILAGAVVGMFCGWLMVCFPNKFRKK